MKGKRMLGAALIGAVIAFPAGMMVGGGSGARQEAAEPVSGEAPAGAGKRAVRDFYSPNVLDDPYVVEQQFRVVEALELSCRRFGERCAEARKARERLWEQRGR